MIAKIHITYRHTLSIYRKDFKFFKHNNGGASKKI
jgi:hypothetical protein